MLCGGGNKLLAHTSLPQRLKVPVMIILAKGATACLIYSPTARTFFSTITPITTITLNVNFLATLGQTPRTNLNIITYSNATANAIINNNNRRSFLCVPLLDLHS